jgi:ABC-type nitrate/sulfonate/bicarbonate transport system substrate-binding protein
MVNDPINLILRKEVADQLGIALTETLEGRILALKGLKIGVAPGPISRLRILFESVGLDADEHIEIVTIGGNGQPGFFAEAKIDGLYAHSPYLETLLVRLSAVMLVNQSAGEVSEMTGGQYHTMLTTRAYADGNQAVIDGLPRAIQRAQDLVHGDIDAAVIALMVSVVVYEDNEFLPTITEIYEPAISATPKISADKFLDELARFPAHQQAPDLSGIDLSEYVRK